MTEDEIKALKAKRQARLERAITPQGSGCAPRYSPPPITIKPPKWDYWRHMPTVAPWKACALALNIEPDSVDYRPKSWDGQPETWRGFPSDEVGDHFIKLLRLLNVNQFEKQHFTENFAMGVRLSEFAVWCAPVVRDLIGSDIPKELAAMAKDAPQATPAPNAEAVTVTSPSGDDMEDDDDGDWIIKCPAIAQKLGEKQLKTTGARQVTARNIHEAVAEELALDPTTHGRQGPRSAHSVRTVGLKEWKFCPPKRVKKVD